MMDKDKRISELEFENKKLRCDLDECLRRLKLIDTAVAGKSLLITGGISRVALRVNEAFK